ncbi:MAG: homocysteine S-methyltransferase family protein [Deltaproteobacteria bacterium]|nr:homocysteine S-methyltransferase family protein [Deltaproteobacteria bacterium]
MNKNKFKNLFKRKIVVLDGAMGTELQKRGMPVGVCPEIWCLENPHVIEEIHGEYVQSGADVVYTCTFGANRLKLGQYNVSNVVEMNRELALLARRAVGKKGLVAGDMGPTGQFIEPFGDLGFEEAIGIFKEQVQGFIEGGVDLFAVETMMDIQEARAALIAVREMTDMFTIVTMTYEKDGRTLNGTDPVTALITLQSLGADAVGCNCSTGPEEMVPLIAAMKPYATVPLVAKPNAGIPELIGNSTVFTMGAKEFAAYSMEFISRGVNVVGGCCGTTPDHIRELKETVAGKKPMAPVRKSVSAVCSSRKTVVFEKDRPLRIIGERINPTGKKTLQEELLQGRLSRVRQLAREQEKAGADLLDVNVSVSGIDEEKKMKEVINTLATSSTVPLVIDSANSNAIEAALRVYPGRALINSITGEKKKIENLIPVAAKYGAMFILLPLTDRGVPETADERKEIIRSVYDKARLYGFTKDDIIVDGLVMTVASNPEAPMETMKTVEWSSRYFKCNTLLGLTNISFGMPQRKWLNGAYLAMAVERGLTVAIANPGEEEFMNVKAASDLLSNRDKDAFIYLKRFAGVPQGERRDASRKGEVPIDEIYHAIIEGNREDIESVLERAVKEEESAEKLVNDCMIPAITKVGKLFDSKEYFLPQLIASAEAMKRGLAYLDPYLRKAQSEQRQKGCILIATVKGDVHDIGKNIVALMLNNQGFDVVDLGKDVSAEVIIEEARRTHPDIIALSALMTTTMVNMKKIIDTVRQEGLGCSFMVGGAVVTASYAEEIKAAYARDGVEAVRVAELLARKARGE